jgi:hypothetical protein
MPHVAVLDDTSVKQIIGWVEAGGKLIVVGPMPPLLGSHWSLRTDPEALQVIHNGSDIEPLQEFLSEKDLRQAGYGYLAPSKAAGQVLEPVPLIVWGRFYPFEPGAASLVTNYCYPLAREALEQGADYGAIMGYSAPGDEAVPGVVWQHVAEGAVLLCGADVFRSYWVQPNYLFHQVFRAWLEILGYQPTVEVIEGNRPADGIELVTVPDPDDDEVLLTHLINLREANYAGMIAERLPAVHGLRLRLHKPRLAGQATLQPAGLALKLYSGDGYTDVDLPVLQTHLCVEIR